MSRYVLKPQGRCASADEVRAVECQAGVTILNRVGAGQAMLVEASESAIHELRGLLADWVIAPELEHPRPGSYRVPGPT